MLLARDHRKAKLCGDKLPVNGQAGTGQGRGAQGQHVDSFGAIAQPFLVAAEHLIIGQHMMGDQHRLGPLQMGIAGHHRAEISPGQPDKGAPHAGQQLHQSLGLLPQIQAQVKIDLIVSAAGSVQSGAGRANPVHQGLFDIHMNIFQLRPEDKDALLDLLLDFSQALADLFAFLGRDQPLPDQHLCMGLAAGDILPEKPAVIMDGGGEGLHRGGCFPGETPSPQFFFVSGH